MPLEMQQTMRVEQRMLLSPQMQQAIYLLQVPLQELGNIIQQEIVQNPLLEETRTESEETRTEPDQQEPEVPAGEDLEFKEQFERLAAEDDEWKEYFRQNRSYNRYRGLSEEKRKYLENLITRTETLSEHLLKQLHTASLSDREREIGEAIIGNIDENGYLSTSIEEIAATTGMDLEKTIQVLRFVQTFHPMGIGARDLRECLLIQINSLGYSVPLAQEIVEGFINELGAKKYPQIARALKTKPAKVQRAAEFISTLEPKPGRMFSSDNTQYITPDIYLEKVGDDYQIIFNNDYMPRLRISNHYRKLLESEETKEETKRYIKEKVTGGLWLIRNIHLRKATLHRITEEIVKRQRQFLDRGMAYLQPLKMSEVAEVVGIHESTVSRAVSNKYIQTPQGTFQLKYFFTAAFSTDSGEDISIQMVKESIIKLIRDEDSQNPLSDQEIVSTLAQQGIKLARRTVAKYRKALDILPSHFRKHY